METDCKNLFLDRIQSLVWLCTQEGSGLDK
jgi:hypothetical protein